MVNVSEEVKRPRRNLPLAIFTALAVASLLYVAVSWIATRVVPPAQLAGSEAPLWEVVRRAAPWIPGWTFTLIALFAVANTGLLNFIMGSRLLYGMACQGLLPEGLAVVHGRTRTPHRCILVILLLAVGLAWSGTLSTLAGTTNVLLLLVFSTVNLALAWLKWTATRRPARGFRVPLPVPLAAAATSLGLIAFSPRYSLALALGILIVSALLLVVRRRT